MSFKVSSSELIALISDKVWINSKYKFACEEIYRYGMLKRLTVSVCVRYFQERKENCAQPHNASI